MTSSASHAEVLEKYPSIDEYFRAKKEVRSFEVLAWVELRWSKIIEVLAGLSITIFSN